MKGAAMFVDNPLPVNIAASLAGAPATGFDRTAAAQQFLETVKGRRT